MDDPSTLWASETLGDWKSGASSYYTRIGEHKVLELERYGLSPSMTLLYIHVLYISYFRWFRDSLPDLLVTQQGCLTKEQFIRLVEWKLSRGKFRPSLRGYAAKQDPKALAAASKEAYRILQEDNGCATRGVVAEETVLQALAVLTELRGVGPATASAILAAMDDSIPFMSDESLVVCLGKREYTVNAYKTLLASMREKQDALQVQGDGISIKDMEAALFASSVAQRAGMSDTAGEQKQKKKKKKKQNNNKKKETAVVDASLQKRQRRGS